MAIECEVIYKKVKRITLKVDYTLKVKVICPFSCSKQEVERFVQKKQKWIQEQISYFKTLNYKQIPLKNNEILLFGSAYRFVYVPEMIGKTQLNHNKKMIYTANLLTQKKILLQWYQKFAHLFLKERLAYWAKKHHFSYNKVTIRNQKTRWGSCSSVKNISLNWRLVKMPIWVIDYIILHELAHTVHLNHSKDFWALIQQLCPYYQKAETWLKEYGHQL
ncbi:MAG: M48 family metallopeptidase [Bacteroidia bacterium]|nr:M48 family metallopeptidase [Bacteroidia bacterium]MDW8347277.1 SprT family zinc-dependent metalloprotease [Bacteroidia bacterium]